MSPLRAPPVFVLNGRSEDFDKRKAIYYARRLEAWGEHHLPIHFFRMNLPLR
jgi:hypothetical protein